MTDDQIPMLVGAPIGMSEREARPPLVIENWSLVILDGALKG